MFAAVVGKFAGVEVRATCRNDVRAPGAGLQEGAWAMWRMDEAERPNFPHVEVGAL